MAKQLTKEKEVEISKETAGYSLKLSVENDMGDSVQFGYKSEFGAEVETIVMDMARIARALASSSFLEYGDYPTNADLIGYFARILDGEEELWRRVDNAAPEASED